MFRAVPSLFCAVADVTQTMFDQCPSAWAYKFECLELLMVHSFAYPVKLVELQPTTFQVEDVKIEKATQATGSSSDQPQSLKDFCTRCFVDPSFRGPHKTELLVGHRVQYSYLTKAYVCTASLSRSLAVWC